MEHASSQLMRRGLGWWLWAVGIVSVFSLLLVPLERLMPPGMAMPPLAFRLLALINPLILVTVACVLGAWLAPRVGFDAPLLRAWRLGRQSGLVLRRQLGPGLVGGIVTAALLIGYSAYSAPYFTGTAAAELTMPLATRLLYGGIGEEVIVRWGVMSLLAWIGWRLAGRPAQLPAAIGIAAAALAALVFAAGHLPLLYTAVAAPPVALVAAVIVGNAGAGLVFGILFWRRGLEAAMIAHATAHLAAWLVLG